MRMAGRRPTWWSRPLTSVKSSGAWSRNAPQYLPSPAGGSTLPARGIPVPAGDVPTEGDEEPLARGVGPLDPGDGSLALGCGLGADDVSRFNRSPRRRPAPMAARIATTVIARARCAFLGRERSGNPLS